MAKERQWGRLLVVATLAVILNSFPQLFTSLASPSLQARRWARSQSVRSATSGRAPSIDEAPVYMTDVDVITGELDVDALPAEMGLYAIYDQDGRLQYIGLSREIRKSVEAHAKAIGSEAIELISTVKCADLPGVAKETLKEIWQDWIQDHMASGGEIPAGNLPENAPGADPRWRARGTQSKPALNLGGSGGIATREDAERAVKEAVENNPVILFMKGTPAMPQCGFSAKTIGILRETGVDFEAVNVLDMDDNPGVREAVKEFGNWPTIPQLYAKGQLIGGADIVSEMHVIGQLETVLKEAVQGKAADSNSDADSSEQREYSRGLIELVKDDRRPTATALCQALDTKLDLYGLRVVDESAAHEGDAGALEMGLTGESHFRVEIIAPDFEGVLPVQRQQMVYDALSDVMPRIHALSLMTRTPAEVEVQ